MGSNETFSDRVKRKEFFIAIQNQLNLKYFDQIPRFSSQRIEQNFMHFHLRGYEHGYYELQVNISSATHKSYYGDDCEDVLSFYYEHVPERREQWLKIVKKFGPDINKAIGRKAYIGEWGDKWATIGICTTYLHLITTPEEYAAFIAKFMIATYPAINKGYKGLKGRSIAGEPDRGD